MRLAHGPKRPGIPLDVDDADRTRRDGVVVTEKARRGSGNADQVS